ncbi:DEAD/DEAH box helicase [Qipengyuania flava]|uniref:UvrD-helicase domain-containing protein n=1 Tax=Qipengyuania flava TaxID=192812 RepID=UPI001ADA715D|nr:UvrD-helicase domain-containing protein [Qipengyuania flava]MBO9505155.1 DEAD/DEAH box helicase [Qipengyuania flava]
MTLLYASTFADALAKLTHQEQKQVKITTVDLMMDPKGTGLSLERLTRAGDDKVWSARVSRDLRIILRREGEDNLLAYVGHHNDAYRWAERRKFIPHERSGAMQIVEVIEGQEKAEPEYGDHSSATETAGEVVQPFWSLTDDQLLDVGVPREWLSHVQEMPEAEIDSLFDRLPAEAAEALYDFATGGKLEDHTVTPAEPGADPYAHPDAQRRFRVFDNVDELTAALDAPFEKWAVFLHPAQRELVQRKVTGPTRVTGSAGTGKTIVALHRAVHLADQSETARVLLTTFSPKLARALSAKLLIQTQAASELRERVTVRPLNDAAEQLYSQQFGEPDLVDDGGIRELIGEAISVGLGGDLTPQFLLEEWQELVDAWGVIDPDSYATLPRIGRRTRLGPKQREAAWTVFNHVRTQMAERGLVSRAMIYNRLTRWLEDGGTIPFEHVVVDEAQDLTVAQVRFLAAVGNGRDDALFLAGDIGQRIFRLPFSWAKLGLDIRGRSHSLRVNYRTSHQIRAMADRLLPPAITDLDGVEEGRRGTVSIFDGPVPEVRLLDDTEAETEFVSNWLQRCMTSGIPSKQIALLVRGPDQLERARKVAENAVAASSDFEPPIVTVMHDAKGLEFRAVAVMACDEDVIPDPQRLASIGDVAEMESVYETERHLLYVACTRARDQLLVSGVTPGSEFLDDLK